ncbi:hypothetical protein OR16_39684 [Cupriavidus basilensis OR16]|uniref:PadR family transcriptional regulator n=1 Tax=Cupriavidus basilensis OR16 TaxID=1127483 RepID=H1SHK0_9BURK|nr:PadR family transcriptional regulator [Cupriavidus basilensis]EHP37993.1 hypothetical protein OR16_39684 [Cupriavidus basilensis OR16]
MSVQHALLTSLLERPSSGYELARRFDRSIGYFWHATHQQIYRELGRMAEHGWIAADEGEGDARNRKKVYFVLQPGRDELVRWVLAPTAGLDLRDEILVKLRADAVVGPLGLGPEMERLIGLHRERLDTYCQIEQRDFVLGRGIVAAAGQAGRSGLKSRRAQAPGGWRKGGGRRVARRCGVPGNGQAQAQARSAAVVPSA